MIFQDRGGVGRVPCLMPCTWIDGWPMLGDENGKIPNDTSLPYMSLDGICGSDEFSTPDLSLYWQWNHNPVDSAWTLTERPGFLRLKTCRIVDNLFLAPNTITQRMTGPECRGTVCLSVEHMIDGDRAGFAAFNGDSGVLTIEKNKSKLYLVMSAQFSHFKEPQHSISSVKIDEQARILLNDEESETVMQDNLLWLRIDGDFNHDYAHFAYCVDGKEWKTVGEPVKMTFDYKRMFMGSKFALFNYATRKLGGYVDIDYFHYEQH